jgi:hypothetical protein
MADDTDPFLDDEQEAARLAELRRRRLQQERAEIAAHENVIAFGDQVGPTRRWLVHAATGARLAITQLPPAEKREAQNMVTDVPVGSKLPADGYYFELLVGDPPSQEEYAQDPPAGMWLTRRVEIPGTDAYPEDGPYEAFPGTVARYQWQVQWFSNEQQRLHQQQHGTAVPDGWTQVTNVTQYPIDDFYASPEKDAVDTDVVVRRPAQLLDLSGRRLDLSRPDPVVVEGTVVETGTTAPGLLAYTPIDLDGRREDGWVTITPDGTSAEPEAPVADPPEPGPGLDLERTFFEETGYPAPRALDIAPDPTPARGYRLPPVPLAPTGTPPGDFVGTPLPPLPPFDDATSAPAGAPTPPPVAPSPSGTTRPRIFRPAASAAPGTPTPAGPPSTPPPATPLPATPPPTPPPARPTPPAPPTPPPATPPPAPPPGGAPRFNWRPPASGTIPTGPPAPIPVPPTVYLGTADRHVRGWLELPDGSSHWTVDGDDDLRRNPGARLHQLIGELPNEVQYNQPEGGFRRVTELGRVESWVWLDDHTDPRHAGSTTRPAADFLPPAFPTDRAVNPPDHPIPDVTITGPAYNPNNSLVGWAQFSGMETPLVINDLRLFNGATPPNQIRGRDLLLTSAVPHENEYNSGGNGGWLLSDSPAGYTEVEWLHDATAERNAGREVWDAQQLSIDGFDAHVPRTADPDLYVTRRTGMQDVSGPGWLVFGDGAERVDDLARAEADPAAARALHYVVQLRSGTSVPHPTERGGPGRWILDDIPAVAGAPARDVPVYEAEWAPRTTEAERNQTGPGSPLGYTDLPDPSAFQPAPTVNAPNPLVAAGVQTDAPQAGWIWRRDEHERARTGVDPDANPWQQSNDVLGETRQTGDLIVLVNGKLPDEQSAKAPGVWLATLHGADPEQPDYIDVKWSDRQPPYGVRANQQIWPADGLPLRGFDPHVERLPARPPLPAWAANATPLRPVHTPTAAGVPPVAGGRGDGMERPATGYGRATWSPYSDPAQNKRYRTVEERDRAEAKRAKVAGKRQAGGGFGFAAVHSENMAKLLGGDRALSAELQDRLRRPPATNRLIGAARAVVNPFRVFWHMNEVSQPSKEELVARFGETGNAPVPTTRAERQAARDALAGAGTTRPTPVDTGRRPYFGPEL